MQIGFVISLIFAILVSVFAIQNSGSVSVNFLFAEFNISQALVILISTALGAVMVMLLGLIKQLKMKRKTKEQGRTMAALEEENRSLKEQIDELTRAQDENSNASLLDEPEISDEEGEKV